MTDLYPRGIANYDKRISGVPMSAVLSAESLKQITMESPRATRDYFAQTLLNERGYNGRKER